MSERLRGSVTTAAIYALGFFWAAAAAAKLLDPLGTYEFGLRVVGPGTAAKAGVVVTVFIEALLGMAMLLRIVRGLALSLAGLAVGTASLLVARASQGGEVPCGCFPLLADTTIDQALVRNAAIAAAVVALLVWNAVARDSAPAPSPAPSTSGPGVASAPGHGSE